ncbi:type II toxin-antitoxin system YafQ family toxin [Solimicrobium silvestre]|uniref:Addiction module toxin, RelE/StbE family n=1 Tax=Solimicrobium silvestre TaxID=2099400 RepID=A0A2S9H3H4_9BURK|nr:type II toxin-antitoxin system YafQ family toxin [Solimicrobium silvestre]PRC94532.1 Addiction module toxin, RelE/StbE family [Solimicrobium silvestre]
MRTIKDSASFKRAYKRVSATPQHKDVNALLHAVLKLLIVDLPLPTKNRDHALSGKLSSYRECHIKPDLLLVYEKPDATILRLVSIGSHSELFG